MGKKKKKKAPQKKKTSQRKSESVRDDWKLDGRKYLDNKDNECDSETTKFSLMGESERNLIEV